MSPSPDQPVPVLRGENPLRGVQDNITRLFGDTFDDRAFAAPDLFVSLGMDLRLAVAIREKTDAYTITAELPGLDPKDIGVTIADGCLTLSGRKAGDGEARDGDFVRPGRISGFFGRLIALPRDADSQAAQASLRDGVLTVQLPRRAGAPGRRNGIDTGKFA